MKLESLFTGAVLFCSTALIHAQGSLTPSGPPMPMMKTLDQIEPRQAISVLPISITRSGSYYLTTNLTCTNGVGITIFTDNVNLDLNGMTLTGAGSATDGIATFPTRTNLVVRNGVLRNWSGMGLRTDFTTFVRIENVSALNCGSYGFFVDENTELLNCTAAGNTNSGFYSIGRASFRSCVARSNKSAGIVTAANSLLDGCTVQQNVSSGISTGADSKVLNCISTGNGGNGISMQERAHVADSTASQNTSAGISVGNHSMVKNCIASTNTGTGITVGQIAVVSECLAAQNGSTGIQVNNGGRVERSTSTGNGSVGINMQTRCTASENTVTGNSSDGIRATSECVISKNHSQGNGAPSSAMDGIYVTGYWNHVEENRTGKNARYGIAIQSASGMNVVIKNVSIQNGVSNYAIASGNDVGPISNASTAASPFANITF